MSSIYAYLKTEKEVIRDNVSLDVNDEHKRDRYVGAMDAIAKSFKDTKLELNLYRGTWYRTGGDVADRPYFWHISWLKTEPRIDSGGNFLLEF